MNTIHSIIPPNRKATTLDSLYQHYSGAIRYSEPESAWHIGPFSTLSFDTYFNSFSLGKWLKYCDLTSLKAKIRGAGTFTCEVIAASKESGNVVLARRSIQLEDCSEVVIDIDLTSAPKAGLAFIKIETSLDAAKIYDIALLTENAPRQNCSLAIVMPTYKRESFVYRNIKLFDELKKKIDPSTVIDLLVIDNGCTLTAPDNSSVKLFTNKNYGGSGGFARGLIEATRESNKYSHIVLSDDDTTIEPTTLLRLQTFYSYCHDSSVAVSGSMLRLDQHNIQYENGAILNSDAHFIPIKSQLDLNHLNGLLENDQEVAKQYAGWWFFSAPTSTFKHLGLPIPVFLKWDDVEYSLRAIENGIKIIDMNGIGVWHEPFENKYSSATFYYEERNSFIGRSIHDSNFSYWAMCKRLLKKTIVLSLGYRYDSAQKAIDGTKAALNGFSKLHDTLPDELHGALLRSQEDVAKSIAPSKIPQFRFDDFKVRLKHKILSKLTLNGHILPSFLIFPDKNIADPGIRYMSTFDWNYIKCLRARRVQYIQPSTLSGFTATRNPTRFFKIVGQATMLTLTSYKLFKKAKVSYVENQRHMTSREFWEEFLDIKKDNFVTEPTPTTENH
ncbi:glycosyltransferase [Microbulbifer sp. JMSA004]|uniref:glycosyltransferase n=1 Tax=unclassified Microbulbifer TaxID=2619833 RepID=UPI0024AD8946|nr:glycosyltransferase [Microbulbifer sp. VAAF005]WHI46640.1 glycosyltransferase [Microbulbifer sp. VAAF005]